MSAFSLFKDKHSKRNKQETPTVAAHYTKLANISALFRYAVLIFVVVFSVYSLSFHSNEITMENFRYMLKFINLGEEADSPAGTLIAFDGSEGNRGMSYKGDLAVLNESGLTITGWDGDIILRETFSFDHPKMEQDSNYIYCYDLGGKELKVFNSYQAMAKTPVFEYPIYGLAASDSGNFAVITSEKSYRSAVYVYDKNFMKRYSVLLGDKHAEFVDISNDGKEFIVAANYSEAGNLVTHILKYRTDTEGVIFEQKFIGEIPLGIYYTDSGYCLMTSDALRLFGSDDSITGEVRFSDKKLLSGSIFGDRALITYAMEGLSGGTEVTVYRNDGSTEFTKNFANSISDTSITGDKLYALSPGELAVCDLKTGAVSVYSVPTSYSSLVTEGERIILFSENQAEYFDTTSFSVKEEQQ